MDKKIASSSRVEALENIRLKHSGNAQARNQNGFWRPCKPLAAYRQSRRTATSTSCTPPARKLNLIEAGHIVTLAWVYETSGCGNVHRVGKYVYTVEPLARSAEANWRRVAQYATCTLDANNQPFRYATCTGRLANCPSRYAT